MTQTFRDILRDRTREAHRRVDTLYGSLALSDRDDFARFLTAHYIALAPVEAAIGVRGERGAVPPRLAPLVRRDLEALGARVPATPDFASLAHADPDGLAYVVAGSHLGARVMRRDWERSSDRNVRTAGRYLSSEAMAEFWPGFVAHLNARPASPVVVERVVDGALAAFGAFERAFALSGESRVGAVMS